MNSQALADIKSRTSRLSVEEQLWLLEHLAHELRVHPAGSRKRFEENLVAMAADPDIQRELREIEAEFATTESDGLESP